MTPDRKASWTSLTVVAAAAAVLAWGFLDGCAAVKETKRVGAKAEQKAVHLSIGAGVGLVTAIATGGAAIPFMLVGAGSVLLIAIVEPDPITVTVEDGGTVVLSGADAAQARNDVVALKTEIERREWKFGEKMAAFVRSVLWSAAFALGIFLLARWEWLRRFLWKKATESHSRFWSLVHVFVGGNWVRMKALGLSTPKVSP